MIRLRTVSFALGLALSATGAWAQETIILGGDVKIGAVTLPDGIQISGGNFELSPDQKLARAYALCYGGWAGNPEDLDCRAIVTIWIRRQTDQTDRAFIEEVARSLK